MGGKRATSLFNPFCSNVTKQVARFCCPFYRTFKAGENGPRFSTLFEDEKSRTETSDEANNDCVVEYLIMFILFLSPSCILKRTGWRMSLQVVAMWERFHLAFYRATESK